MTAIPQVSVVMSVYNGAAHLSAALESLLAQTHSDFELIVINDGSADESPAVLQQFAQRDARLRVITQSNTGLTQALIHGCRAARGVYIARHDADDWSEPTRLAAQVALLDRQPDIGFVSCATQYVGPNGERLEVVARTDAPAEATRKLLDERQGPPAHGSVMFRRSLYAAVGGYRGEFYFGQDSDLWMRMAERMPLAYLPDCLYSARRDPNSLSGRQGGLQHAFGELGQQCRAARREGRTETQYLIAAKQLCETIPTVKDGSNCGRSTMAYLIGTTLKQQGDRRARGYFWQAITLNPYNWRAWCRFFAAW